MLRDTELGPDVLGALVQFGWLFEEQKQDSAAVRDSVGALVYQSLSVGTRPAQPGKASVLVDIGAIEDAFPWLKPGTPLTAESAGKSLEIVAKCASVAGFTPQIFANRLRQMVEGRAV